MGDVIKGAESALFGSWLWAAEHLGPLAEAPEPTDRLSVLEELLRAYGRLAAAPETPQGRVDAAEMARAADEAALALVEAEAEMPETLVAGLASVRKARDRLLDLESAHAQAAYATDFFLAFDLAWARDREGLLLDAALAAVLHGNLLMGLAKDEVGKREHARASAHLYTQLGAELAQRVQRGENVWRESARSAYHRAEVAWRALGSEDEVARARDLARSLAP